MDRTIEFQLQKVLNMVSEKEKQRNKALGMQTSRLVKALLYMKALVSTPATSLKKVKA